MTSADWLYALALSPFGVLLVAYTVILYRMHRHDRMSLAEKDGCQVLHDTARAEREMYGEVKSESVAAHVESCCKELLSIRYV